jgi:glucokinase
MGDLTLGVDLSDQTARLVIVDAGGSVKARGDVLAPPAGRAKELRDAVKKAIAASGGKIAGVAVAMPAAAEPIPADIASALADVAKGVEQFPIAAGTAAALAEQWCGAAVGTTQLVTFSIAQHVTAGILINGEPWMGAHGLASSVCWMGLNPVEREDYRRYGGLEAEVSSAGIVRRFVWRIKSGDRSRVVDAAGGDLTKITAADIFQGARSGDGVAISVVRDTAKYVGMAVANLASILDPEAVVLGGIIAASGDMMLEPVRVEACRRMCQPQSEQVRIVLSTLGQDAVAIGAARAAARVGA